jgi:hypothetical protein
MVVARMTKLPMTAEPAISAITVLLVAGCSLNTFK